MEYVYFFGFVAVMVLLLVLLTRMENNAKKKYKREAYQLLETAGPDPKTIKNTIRHLGLYRGRWRKDRECFELIDRLKAKLGNVDK